ncbi:hypothetical protein RFI_01997 [Reticulomyxa filosa]|uniref:Kelch motif family protein n=1 Tax=Reticulomyxa filosa TaxID=46433 RepID=X6PBM0_RETFI|nr:hypothetical protein RFI_01997 [Reticulomyxa filosa]|eukprot:ETO35077.1 hypothetical protein RFI_01997 [Reticulomyxa filosa]
MGNRTTIQKPHEHLNTSFQTLKELPTPLVHPQCVLHNHELLVCGGANQRACYSYHTLKNEYKFICEYPRDVTLVGYCVVKLVDNNNDNRQSDQITLLSFGSHYNGKNKHTLVMKYVSVWSNTSLSKSNELNNNNQWIPFTDNENNPIIIGRDYDDYREVRALIGGSNSHLLFITYPSNNISVFDLNTSQFIQHNKLPSNIYIDYHCFVSNPENDQGQEMIKTNEKSNKQYYQMLLFCDGAGLSIEYEEINNIFQFHKIFSCDNIAPFYNYAYVCINDIILFFGGWHVYTSVVSKLVHKYSIRENKWMTFENTLPSPLCECVAILSEKYDYIHIIGGEDDKYATVSAHMKTKVRVWDPSQLVMICLLLFILMKHEIRLII